MTSMEKKASCTLDTTTQRGRRSLRSTNGKKSPSPSIGIKRKTGRVMLGKEKKDRIIKKRVCEKARNYLREVGGGTTTFVGRYQKKKGAHPRKTSTGLYELDARSKETHIGRKITERKLPRYYTRGRKALVKRRNSHSGAEERRKLLISQAATTQKPV